MHPWERRLADLAQLLKSCHATYMEPDLFRMNTNQFLQTARTITFIIQKNKASIHGFSTWYDAVVVQPWQKDTVMAWARDARNTIEKEGDLEFNSTLNLTLLSSYLAEDDARIQCGHSELLRAGVKRLVRLAQKALPTGVSDAAVVKIERRWVTATLPSWELLQALSYVYGRIHDVCKSLAAVLSTNLDSGIPDAREFDRYRDQAQQITYLKLATFQTHSLSFRSRRIQKDEYLPPDLRQKLETVVASSPRDATLQSTAQFLTAMAETTFRHFGNHVPMLFLYDDRWVPIDMISTTFADQADKYIFWRRAADRVINQRAHGIAWISELWMRGLSGYPFDPIRKLPIVGERLHLALADRSGHIKEISWDIIRSSGDPQPLLRPVVADETNSRVPGFLYPIRRAWGLPDS
jgi:hypothetical protein